MSKKFDVVGFGSATLDYICLVNTLANYHQSTFISEVKFFGGGCVPTALVTLQRLGGKATFIGSLGDDWIGQEIIKGLVSENVNVSGIQINPGKTSPFSFIQVNRKLGKRAITYFPGSSERLKFDEASEDAIRKSKVLLIDGFVPEVQLKAAQFAHTNGVKVMIDANIVIDGTIELLSSVDYIITSKSFLFEFSSQKDIDSSLRELYYKYKPEVLITTLGEDGSVALINDRTVYVNSFKVDVKDTTGAGDVYHGAFLFGILNNWKVKDIMIFASAVSAIKCTSYGGRLGIPDFKTTMKFFRSRDIDLGSFGLKYNSITL